MKENNVYLIPCGDRTYCSQVSIYPPNPSAIFMVAEGTYPVELWWSKHDLNMCREWASETCESREALIEALNFLGKCGHNVETLWDYNDSTTTNAEITRLFDACYNRKKEEIEAAFDAAIEEFERRGSEEPVLVFC